MFTFLIVIVFLLCILSYLIKKKYHHYHSIWLSIYKFYCYRFCYVHVLLLHDRLLYSYYQCISLYHCFYYFIFLFISLLWLCSSMFCLNICLLLLLHCLIMFNAIPTFIPLYFFIILQSIMQSITLLNQ